MPPTCVHAASAALAVAVPPAGWAVALVAAAMSAVACALGRLGRGVERGEAHAARGGVLGKQGWWGKRLGQLLGRQRGPLPGLPLQAGPRFPESTAAPASHRRSARAPGRGLGGDRLCLLRVAGQQRLGLAREARQAGDGGQQRHQQRALLSMRWGGDRGQGLGAASERGTGRERLQGRGASRFRQPQALHPVERKPPCPPCPPARPARPGRPPPPAPPGAPGRRRPAAPGRALRGARRPRRRRPPGRRAGLWPRRGRGRARSCPCRASARCRGARRRGR
jgi:hypothetical protein